jgi:hypothetical protein
MAAAGSSATREIGPALNFPADGSPDLRFTRPAAVKVDGKPLPKAMLYWNAMMFELVKIAAGKLSPDALRQSILVNFVEGEGSDCAAQKRVSGPSLSRNKSTSGAPSHRACPPLFRDVYRARIGHGMEPGPETFE